MNLSSPRTVYDLLKRYNLQPDKAFGQNFLIDAHALQMIVNDADLQPHDTVLEIGPGLGVLTQKLAQKARRVISVELDQRLIPALNETLADYPNVTLIQADGLHFDMNRLPKESLLVANLPYNVATPLIMKALESGTFKRLLFLVQKEVAQRLSAEKGDKNYGALSVMVAYFGRARRLRDLKPGVFFPPPEVTSSLVRIDINNPISAKNGFFDFIHQSFRHRRKTLFNSLSLAGYEPEHIRKALLATGLRPDIRAEALDLNLFSMLFASLAESAHTDTF